MNTSPLRILFAALCLYTCCILLVMPGAAGPCDWGGDYPYAGLTYEVMDAETLPVTVQFNSTSRSPPGQQFSSWHWDFGDGTTSTVYYNHRSVETVHPRHTFSTYQDHFDVCLKVTTQCDKSNEACERVQAYCTKPKAGFTLDVSEGPAPLMVHVADTSEHTPGSVTTWVYKKNGGTISTGRDFAGTFTEPGVYTITQMVKKNCNPASDSFSRQLRVTPAVVQGTVMNISFPTTTPTIAIVGVYFNFSNATSPSATISPATKATPFALQTFSLVPTSRGSTASPTPVTSGPSHGIPAAAGTPAIPGTGTLAVTTNPHGAQVIIDGVLRGASPATIPGLAAGAHMLRLEREGYQVMTVPFTIDDGKTTEYSTALVPDAGGSTVSLPFIVAAVLILVLASAGAYLYTKRKKTP